MNFKDCPKNDNVGDECDRSGDDDGGRDDGVGFRSDEDDDNCDHDGDKCWHLGAHAGRHCSARSNLFNHSHSSPNLSHPTSLSDAASIYRVELLELKNLNQKFSVVGPNLPLHRSA